MPHSYKPILLAFHVSVFLIMSLGTLSAQNPFRYVDMTPYDMRQLYCAEEGNPLLIGGTGGLIRSVAVGSKVEVVKDEALETACGVKALYRFGDDIVCITDCQEVFRKLSNSQWEKLADGDIVAASEMGLFAVINGGVLTVRDVRSGESRWAVNIQRTLRAITLVDTNTICVGYEQGDVARITMDGGVETSVQLDQSAIARIELITSNYICASTATQSYLSEDSGVSWYKFDNRKGLAENFCVGAACQGHEIVDVSQLGDTCFVLVRSYQSEYPQTQTRLMSFANGVSINDAEVYLSGVVDAQTQAIVPIGVKRVLGIDWASEITELAPDATNIPRRRVLIGPPKYIHKYDAQLDRDSTHVVIYFTNASDPRYPLVTMASVALDSQFATFDTLDHVFCDGKSDILFNRIFSHGNEITFAKNFTSVVSLSGDTTCQDIKANSQAISLYENDKMIVANWSVPRFPGSQCVISTDDGFTWDTTSITDYVYWVYLLDNRSAILYTQKTLYLIDDTGQTIDTIPNTSSVLRLLGGTGTSAWVSDCNYISDDKFRARIGVISTQDFRWDVKFDTVVSRDEGAITVGGYYDNGEIVVYGQEGRRITSRDNGAHFSIDRISPQFKLGGIHTLTTDEYIVLQGSSVIGLRERNVLSTADELSQQMSILLFHPQPASDAITVSHARSSCSCTALDASVMSLTGKVSSTFVRDNQAMDKYMRSDFVISVKDLPAGLYLLTVSCPHETQIGKVVVTR